MRIVVSGTHASGKSTLVADVVAACPGYDALEDPYELLDEDMTQPDAGAFVAQLKASATRLLGLSAAADVVAERGPLDFLAYLDALERLGRPTAPDDVYERCLDLTFAAMSHVDLLVVLPLESGSPSVGEDEDPALRAAMDAALLDLVSEAELTAGAEVVELAGSAAARRDRLIDTIRASDR